MIQVPGVAAFMVTLDGRIVRSRPRRRAAGRSALALRALRASAHRHDLHVEGSRATVAAPAPSSREDTMTVSEIIDRAVKQATRDGTTERHG
jgi:hypothetical protein